MGVFDLHRRQAQTFDGALPLPLLLNGILRRRFWSVWRARRSVAKDPVAIDDKEKGILLLGLSAAFAANETLSIKHDADSCATVPRKVSISMRNVGTLD